MNTHNIELPPLPEGLAGYTPTQEAHMTLNNMVREYARAAIEADRKRRGEPDFFTYVINGHHRGISETAPPDDSYDEGTLQPLYTAPQPSEPVKVPSESIDIEDVRQYLESWGCLAHPGVRALLERYSKGEP